MWCDIITSVYIKYHMKYDPMNLFIFFSHIHIAVWKESRFGYVVHNADLIDQGIVHVPYKKET